MDNLDSDRAASEREFEKQFEIDELEMKLQNAEHWLNIASNPITVRNRKKEIKRLKEQISTLKLALK